MRTKYLKMLLVSLITPVILLSGCSSKKQQNVVNSNNQGYYSAKDSSSLSGMEVDERTSNIVFFGFDSDALPDDISDILSAQVDLLLSNDKLEIVVEGHCDRVGTREYNMALGERRAEKVKRFLVSCGISDNRISTVSFGKERPFSFGTDSEDDRKNRRAVLVVVKEEKK